jgi:hypothetical protein
MTGVDAQDSVPVAVRTPQSKEARTITSSMLYPNRSTRPSFWGGAVTAVDFFGVLHDCRPPEIGYRECARSIESSFRAAFYYVQIAMSEYEEEQEISKEEKKKKK